MRVCLGFGGEVRMGMRMGMRMERSSAAVVAEGKGMEGKMRRWTRSTTLMIYDNDLPSHGQVGRQAPRAQQSIYLLNQQSTHNTI